MKNEKSGFLNLFKKSFTVITAALSTLSQSKAETPVNNIESDAGNNISFEAIHKNVLKPKLTLKLNMANPETAWLLCIGLTVRIDLIVLIIHHLIALAVVILR